MWGFNISRGNQQFRGAQTMERNLCAFCTMQNSITDSACSESTSHRKDSHCINTQRPRRCGKHDRDNLLTRLRKGAAAPPIIQAYSPQPTAPPSIPSREAPSNCISTRWVHPTSPRHSTNLFGGRSQESISQPCAGFQQKEAVAQK